jgi:hypothetical protein
MISRKNIINIECRDSAENAPIKNIRWGLLSLLGLILIVFNTGWIAHSEMKTGVTEITIATLFAGVLFILFLITLFNLIIYRSLGEKKALNQPELMILYTMLTMSSVVAGVGHMGFFTPFLTNPFWFANASNDWKSIWPYLPAYMGPRDHAILKGFYEGRSTFFRPEVIHAWIFPLAIWSLFFLLLLWTTLCLAIIVRKRWAEEEHLPFPVIVLPLEITREGAPIYKNYLLWIGFAIPLFFHSLNSLASMSPQIPSFPMNSARDLTAGLPFPMNGLDPIFYPIHPAGVGFGYLINTDVLFSLWFFYILRKAINFWGILMGWREPGSGQFYDGADQFPYTSAIAWGAWLALGIGILWQSRSWLSGFLSIAFKSENKDDHSHEPLSPRAASIGFLVGFAAICIFVWSSGCSLWVPVVFMAIYFILMLVLARLEAETAVPSPFLAWVDPQSILTTLGGTMGMSRANLTHIGLMSWYNTDYRAAALPHNLQGFEAQRRAGSSMKPLVAVMMGSAAVALVCALVWDLQLYYTNGAATGHVNQWRIYEGSLPWTQVQSWFQHPTSPNKTAWTAAIIGAGITGLLSLMRNLFVNFPLSPAAFVLNTSWANDLFWLDMLIAWIFKSLLLRYGGMKAYRRMLPFFLGLILGDFVTGSFWTIIGAILHLSLFRTFST